MIMQEDADDSLYKRLAGTGADRNGSFGVHGTEEPHWGVFPADEANRHRRIATTVQRRDALIAANHRAFGREIPETDPEIRRIAGPLGLDPGALFVRAAALQGAP
jgi:hypothetical protein